MSTIAAGTTSTTALVETGDTTGNLVFQTNGTTTAMTIDTSQNLGLGVTPSGWSPGKAIEVGNAGNGLYGTGANDMLVTSGAYYNSGWKYAITNSLGASAYEQYNSQHRWYVVTPAAHNAGDAITFTQAMTLDASGNLGVGTSSPISRFDVRAPAGELGRFAINNTGVGYLLIGGGTSTSEGLRLSYNNSDGSSTINNFYNAHLAFATNNTERARINSSGVLFVGTTGLPAGNGTALTLSGSAGVARIYGTTEATAALYVDKSTNTNTTSQVFIGFTKNAQADGNGQINGNGASQAAFGSYSDRRLKENIVDLPSQLENICALRPVEFDYIESEGGGHQISFIAQEFEQVYPDAIGERADGMKTLTGWGKTEARLVKAIQEQQVLITTLQAEVTALKEKING